MAAGLERLLEALEEFRFEQPILDYLDSLKLFTPAAIVSSYDANS